MILIKLTDETKAVLSTIALAAVCSSAIVPSIIFSAEYEKTNKTINEISNQLTELRVEIQDAKFSREGYFEKRLQELDEKIREIDAKFEEAWTVYDYDEPEEDEEVVPETIYYSKERLPLGVDTNRYDCEHYIFGAGSDQRRLQSYCYTDERGLRFYSHNGQRYYCVAMGGAYGIDIGDIWDVTLECGESFGIILSDYQHPITDVDPNDFGEIYERDIYGNVVGILRNYDEEPVCHVLEFIVDMDSLHKSVKMAGTVSALKEFGGLYGDGGNIIDIKYKGRAWQP